MSNSSNKIGLVSRDFIKLVLPILKENCTVDAETGQRACMSRPAVAAALIKKHRKELPTKNERLLVTLLELAENAGQLTGFESRLGRNGGIFKSEEKVAKKAPKKDKAPAAVEPEVAVEEAVAA